MNKRYCIAWPALFLYTRARKPSIVSCAIVGKPAKVIAKRSTGNSFIEASYIGTPRWSQRGENEMAESTQVVVTSQSGLAQDIATRNHRFRADEPAPIGADTG